MKLQNYNHTLRASYTGSATMAIVNNFVPLLFLTFQATYGISLPKITLLVTLNFLIQLCVDLLAAKFVDRIGYRICIVSAQVLSALGMAGLAFLPDILPSAYAGLVVCVVLYAIGGGLNEVLISPIVEACPTARKTAAMSLLHSFYCWGSILVVLGSTLMFRLLGIANWRIISLIWALVPLYNCFYFSQVPLFQLHEEGKQMGIGKLLSTRLFWVFGLLMLCSGAAENAMSQWASAFAESGLHVSKTVGDLAGPCMFAVFMGIARFGYSKFEARLPLYKALMACGVLCVVSYALATVPSSPVLALVGCGLCGLSVGILWPGTLSLASAKFPQGGTALFALMALAGDVGCSSGPTVVGMVAAGAGGQLKTGLMAASVFPILMLIALAVCAAMVRQKKKC